jgi:hypothetical protein
MDVPEGLLGERHRADKLAILCATKPLFFVFVRTLATIVVFLTLAFAFDVVSRFFGWAAGNDPAAFYFWGEEATDENRQALFSLADGLPYDLPRLISLGLALALLVGLQLLATRGLTSGVEATTSSIVQGLPWPGRWQLAARYARALRPWAITASGIVPIAWLVRSDWPLSGEDWFSASGLLLVSVMVVWGVAYAAWKGGAVLTELLPSFVDVGRSELQQARKLVEQQDQEEAIRRWPPKKELRLSAAIRVFAAPPSPRPRRHQRRRRAWWTGTETSVEALATELVLQALIEARDLGLVSISRWRRRNPRVVASLPPERQPRGLAALVAGFHREGLTPGRVVNAKLSEMLSPVYGADQYAKVISIALEDLEYCGVATKDPGTETWRLSAHRLEQAGTALASAPSRAVEAADGPTIISASARDLATLRRRVARKLSGKRTTEVEGEPGLWQTLFNAYQYWAERSERGKYQLPTRSVAP